MAVEESIRALCQSALARTRHHSDVTYGEIRWVRERGERASIRNAVPDGVGRNDESGFGIRIIARGAWGFACTPLRDEGAVQRAVDEAVAIARASAAVAKQPVVFPERDAQRGRYESKVEIDPFSIPLDRKLADLAAPESAIRSGGVAIRSAEAWMSWTEVEKLLLTTEGTDVEQRFVYGGAGMVAVAAGDDGSSQRRSFPGPSDVGLVQGGYEQVAREGLVDAAPRVSEEAIALLKAPQCPTGTRDVLLASSQMALQIHESCGHPTELDRALGEEISLAGGSFLQPDMLGKFRYGSDLVTLTADSTAPGGLGTFGWDDEGTPARKVPLIDRGLFSDYLSSRQAAAALGRKSTATVRADGFNRLPMIRMVNVSLEPREGTLDELVADTKDGVLLDVNKSWSIDDLRLNFQFSCEAAWEIKNGKRARLLRDARYTGITPEFWRSCNAICGPGEARIWGLSMCGKGDPIQLMAVAHGAPPARFRRVEVGHS